MREGGQGKGGQGMRKRENELWRGQTCFRLDKSNKPRSIIFWNIIIFGESDCALKSHCSV